MKALVFDTGAIISIATNNLLWVLDELAKIYKGKFYVCESVKDELILKPLKGKKYKLEAMQILSRINDGIIEVYKSKKVTDEGLRLLNLANSCFKARKEYIRLLHLPEIETIALAKEIGAEAMVVDERTMRMIVESPNALGKFMQKKLHTGVVIQKKNLDSFLSAVKGINIIRSVELMVVAYEKGLLNKYFSANQKIVKMNQKKQLLEGLLWGLKLRGASMRVDEIKKIIEIEKV